MQILNLVKQINSKKKEIKKSQILLIGSLLVFVGILVIFWNNFLVLRDEVYSDLKVDIVIEKNDGKKDITKVPVTNNLPEDTNQESNNTNAPTNSNINYDNYLGVLEIPRISLKRGFFDINSKYNDIQYNVTMVKGSTMPDKVNGNLILMAHSGDAYISYFAYLYMLKPGDPVYVTYEKKKYTYRIVNIYDVPKVGQVTINRNYNRTTLTLITCTKNNDQSQTIYIAEQV